MKFSGKLKKLRKEKRLNQEELANLLGVTKRTVQNYENSNMYPKKRAIYARLASIFDVDINYLLTEDEELRLDAYKKGGTKAMREIGELVENVCGLFAGGELPEEDIDAAMRAISEAYFSIKAENSKYSPKNKKSYN